MTDKQTEQIAERAVGLAVQMAREEFDKPYPKLMTLPQFCAFPGTTQPTIHAKVRDGLPVSYGLGEKSPGFVRSEIDKWLKPKE